MKAMEQLCDFLGRLNEAHISYRLQMVSECADSILVEIAIPGERWEVNFYVDGRIYVEKFIGNGEVFGAKELQRLFEEN
jgi:hypothetical protein